MRVLRQMATGGLGLAGCALLAAAGGWGGDAVRAAGVPEVAMKTPDAQCRGCHQAIYDRYERTPMARGSGAAVAGLDMRELAAKGFTHEASGVTYRVGVREGEATLTYARGEAGRPPLDGVERLRYFVGSGRRGRTFLYEQGGLWFETPINWYGKKGVWDMAPAYERATEMPAALPVDANCLHCHASEVGRADGPVRNRFAGAPFAAGGVGCAACHGDPAAHLAAVRAGRPTVGTMVMAGRLDAVRRDSVCLQCHLEGDAVVYRLGRELAEFKAGEDLFATAVYFVDKNRALEGGRATSQYEAMLKSACRRAVGDRLTCTTCHDPHGSPTAGERVGFYRSKCLQCHTGEAMATRHHPEQPDCATCHMPTRKTLDISHDQVTDHDIEARPVHSEATARTRGFDLTPVGPVTVGARETGLAYAQLAQHGDRAAGERALTLLEQARREGADDVEVREQLGFLLQVSGQARAAAEEYAAALKLEPGNTTAAANLAVMDAGTGDAAEAVRLLRMVVEEDPSQTAAGLNLGFLLCRMGKKEEAATVVRRMLVFHPDSGTAWRMLRDGEYGGQRCRVE